MKFFRTQPLKIQAAYLLAFFFLALVLQYLFIGWKIQSVEELHYHDSFARRSQLACQEVFLKTTLFLQGQTGISSQLVADIDQHDHLLEILGEGGRIDGTPIFLDKLSRLPKISYNELLKHWNIYKTNVVQATIDANEFEKEKVRKLLPGRWLSVSSWYDKLINDLDETLAKKSAAINYLIIGFLGADLVIILLGYYVFRRKLIKPLELVEQNTLNQRHTHGLPPNEIGKVADGINAVVEQLKDASDFVQNIGKGNLTMDYRELDPNYQPGKSKLADALIEMQQKLKELNDEERKRQWINEGLSKFVDILRSSGNDDIHVLSDKIISALVQYTGANQGGLYLLNDENDYNKYLELISLFAFDTKKFETQHIKLGEGILGQTFLEKQTTYITHVPNDYVRITSGLGDTNAKAVLVVPLKIDQDVYGVVELASLTEFKQHEIGFVERLGETIASTLANVKAAQRNRKLLEESETAAEMMRAQEEEMRQNMEELSATQEEIARKERDYIAKIQDLEQKLGSSGTDALTLQETRKELTKLQKESADKIRELEDKLSKRPSGEEAWKLAEEVERTLRVNLEALKVTQEELDRRR